MALSRDPSREIKGGQLTNCFLCLLPPYVFSSFRWAWGPELVLGTPGILEAAFLYKLGTELATRDWKSGRESWLNMLRRACSFTAAYPLGLWGKPGLSAANICICDSIVLSEGEVSRWREPRPKLKCSFLFHGITRNVKLGSPPTLPWSLWLLHQCSSTCFHSSGNTLSFQKVSVPRCLVSVPKKCRIALIYNPMSFGNPCPHLRT